MEIIVVPQHDVLLICCFQILRSHLQTLFMPAKCVLVGQLLTLFSLNYARLAPKESFKGI